MWICSCCCRWEASRADRWDNPVGFFRGDLLGSEGLPHLTAPCLIRAPSSSLSSSSRFDLRFPLGRRSQQGVGGSCRGRLGLLLE